MGVKNEIARYLIVVFDGDLVGAVMNDRHHPADGDVPAELHIALYLGVLL